MWELRRVCHLGSGGNLVARVSTAPDVKTLQAPKPTGENVSPLGRRRPGDRGSAHRRKALGLPPDRRRQALRHGLKRLGRSRDGVQCGYKQEPEDCRHGNSVVRRCFDVAVSAEVLGADAAGDPTDRGRDRAGAGAALSNL